MPACKNPSWNGVLCRFNVEVKSNVENNKNPPEFSTFASLIQSSNYLFVSKSPTKSGPDKVAADNRSSQHGQHTVSVKWSRETFNF